MNLEKLSEMLLKDVNTMDIVSKISCIEMSDIEAKTSCRVPILKRCLKFLLSAAKRRNYSHIPPVLTFVRMANSLDNWLASSSSIILPHIYELYCTILAEADPCAKVSPAKMNAQISPRVKRDHDAMRALSSVFQVSIGFCDLVDEDNQRQLGKFLTCSAAVLFGSDFQKERETLNERSYAMDELARYSSCAFSNIMLAYPAVIPMAEGILGRWLQGLFRFLHSAPELSINISLILILRSLYQGYESNQGDSHKHRSLIDNVFSCSRFGRQSVLKLFQKIDLLSEDAAFQAENISLKMYSGDYDDACFKTINCSIQVKERPCHSRRRVPFRSASIDWNRNSFVIHRHSQPPEYWPLFSVSDLDWKKGRKELHLLLEGRSGKQTYGIVIRFQSDSVSASKKNIIEHRLRRIMEQVKLQSEHTKTNDHIVTARKASQGTRQGTECSIEAGPDGDYSDREESTNEGPQLSAGAKQKHIFSETPPHKVYTNSCHNEEDSLTSGQNSYAGSEKEDEQDFIAESPETEHNRNKSDHSSSVCGAGDSVQLSDATTNRGPQKLLSAERLVENHFSSEGSEKTSPSKSVHHVSSPEEDYPHASDGENSQDQQLELSYFAVPSLSENQFHKASHKSCEHRNSQHHALLLQGPGSSKNMCEERAPDMVMKDSEVGVENEEEFRKLSVEDENLRQKLQSVIKNMLQWKQGQASQVVRDTKVSIANIKEKRTRQDQELVAKFADEVRKHRSLHTGKLTDTARHAKGVLQKTRKRLSSFREKLVEGRQNLKVMKTESSTDIANARDLMRKEREELIVKLNQCVANTQRRSESRAKRNSVLQSLARLLKEG